MNLDDGTSTICSTEGMTDKIRNRILDTHNEFRSYIARGLARNGTKGYAPEASVMYKLRYDCELEKLAMEHAKKCTNDHRPASERGGNGENIYTIFISGLDKAMIGEDVS
ncbi:SCP-like protein [Oesophagostomum dentatum]|uniref:SCP-like protein n=1 Tax=Oesophagostomum dentatum TaxID=61180 RepID=A0A0B1TT09_OESDE|nr:SCP-like protein [Oesophagostomum dentatum]